MGYLGRGLLLREKAHTASCDPEAQTASLLDGAGSCASTVHLSNSMAAHSGLGIALLPRPSWVSPLAQPFLHTASPAAAHPPRGPALPSFKTKLPGGQRKTQASSPWGSLPLNSLNSSPGFLCPWNRHWLFGLNQHFLASEQRRNNAYFVKLSWKVQTYIENVPSFSCTKTVFCSLPSWRSASSAHLPSPREEQIKGDQEALLGRVCFLVKPFQFISLLLQWRVEGESNLTCSMPPAHLEALGWKSISFLS